ncbi:MAG: A-macroglobulin complement component, partial [Planctomycetes bacterium]|nr:A-macroglobulin complement component [Planctomycetota bacterium]
SFSRKRRALHCWIEDKDCSDGYILWALLSSGTTKEELSLELDSFISRAVSSKNSYVKALGALVATLSNHTSEADQLMSYLAQMQDESGKICQGDTTIVGSRGNSLDIETTSLGVLAWLNSESHAPQSTAAMRWIAEICKSGRYGSTQSTVLALKAIVAYDKAMSKPTNPGTIQLMIDGTAIGSPIAFDQKAHGAIEFAGLSKFFQTAGRHEVKMLMDNGSEMPCSISVNYHVIKPESSLECPLDLQLQLSGQELMEGQSTEVKVRFENISNEAVPSPIAIIGLPGGLEARHDKLKELKKSNVIASYEIIGRDIVLYWRGLAAGEVKDFFLDVNATLPGEYEGPASRAYLYYGDEFKKWLEPLKVTIQSQKSAQ